MSHAKLLRDREDISDEGAAGTVTREIFEEWVADCLVPVLGKYEDLQPRSVVMLDNASTHMSMKVVDMIENAGAKVFFTAPFSPDLNPIENYFSIYKNYLKKHNDEMINDWEKVHLEALSSVKRDTGIKYFCRCGIPGAFKVTTTEEQKKLNNDPMVVLIVILFLHIN